jgi:MarR family transcriptional regulator, transcriptional regulator for hemolysin
MRRQKQPRALLKTAAAFRIIVRMRNTHMHIESPPRRAASPARGTRSPSPADRLESLGILIAGLSKAWREELDRRLRPLGLTRVQWQALLWLSRAGGTLVQRELSGYLDIGAPATVALVDRMERDGLVTRSAVPDDRRRNAVVLTPKARRLLATIETAAGKLRREVMSGLTREEVDTLFTLLGKAKQRIDAIRT